MLIALIILLISICLIFLGVFSNNSSYILEDIFYRTLSAATKAIQLATLVLHLLGKLFILIILTCAIFILFNDLLLVFDFKPISDASWYSPLLQLFKQPHTWAASTAIIAATTAITASKKLEMDTQDYLHKMRERNDERHHKQQLAQKEQLHPLYRSHANNTYNSASKTHRAELDSDTKDS